MSNIAKSSMNRFIFFLMLGALIWIIILGRLFQIQILNGQQYKRIASNQHQVKIEYKGDRGTIYDCRGRRLAYNKKVYSLYADVSLIKNPKSVDKIICGIMEVPAGTFLSKIRGKERSKFVWINRKLSSLQAEQIKELNIPGLNFMEENARVYPFRKYAAQTIGYVDIDNNGIDGLECSADNWLQGGSVEALLFTDAKHECYPLLFYKGRPPQDGSSVYLTLDIDFQSIVEEKLAAGVEENRGVSGTAIFLNPYTGKILAMASYPTFDPNDYKASKPEYRKNRVVTDIYEPGSTFKLVTATTILEEQLFPLSKKVFCENGEYAYFPEHSWKDVHPYDSLSIRDVFINSSNIGTIKLAQQIGPKLLYKYAKNYGFGSLTEIDFVGEVCGVVRRPEQWSGYSIGSFPIGQEVSVTALQMVTAYAAVANGGYLVKPYIIDRIINPDGSVEFENQTSIIRRVMSRETVDSLICIFKDVVKNGTGKMAYIDGLEIAGKTGTAQKASNRGYSENNVVASFVGFTPADNPALVGIITVDSPRRSHYGGSVAGPIFRDIIKEAFSSYDQSLLAERANMDNPIVEPETTVVVPDLARMFKDQAEELIRSRDLKPVFINEGNLVNAQNPDNGQHARKGQEVYIHLINKEEVNPEVFQVPNVKGHSVRAGINKLAKANIPFRVIGSGIISEQKPPPGTFITRGHYCLLICKPGIVPKALSQELKIPQQTTDPEKG
ncbi:PASTA domain-containing protein [bacterium]|nr:PASTA domain-containing protein [bacterium]